MHIHLRRFKLSLEFSTQRWGRNFFTARKKKKKKNQPRNSLCPSEIKCCNGIIRLIAWNLMLTYLSLTTFAANFATILNQRNYPTPSPTEPTPLGFGSRPIVLVCHLNVRARKVGTRNLLYLRDNFNGQHLRL